MIKPESKAFLARDRNGILEFRDEEMTLSEPRSNSPARLRVSIDRVFGAIVELMPIRLGACEDHVGIGRHRAIDRHCPQPHFIEDEIPCLAPAAWPILRQTRVWQHFEHHGRDAIQVGFGLDRDRVVDGIDPSAQDGAVGQIRVGRSPGGGCIDQLEGLPDIAALRHGFFPGRQGLGDSQFFLRERFLQCRLAGTHVVGGVGKVGGRNRHRGFDAVIAAISAVVENGVQLVVLVVRDGVVLVRVALGAGQGQSKPGRANGGDAILDGLDAVLLGIATAFVIDLGVSIETSGDELIGGWRRKQISSELFDRELIEGLVLVECLEDVISVRPDLAG